MPEAIDVATEATGCQNHRVQAVKGRKGKRTFMSSEDHSGEFSWTQADNVLHDRSSKWRSIWG
jgi:hypothetical protein